LIASLFVLLIILLALFGPFLLPHDPYRLSLQHRLLPPLSESADSGLRFWLGTDQQGRDVLSRLALGARVSLSIGVAGVLISGAIGTTLGLAAGFLRGRTENAIMRITDLQMAFPGLIIAIFVLFTIGPGFVNLLLVIALLRWPVYARVARGISLNVSGQQFVESSRALGASSGRIIWEHILPNSVASIAILGTLELVYLMMLEATLSFLGLGVQPPETSWGLMIAQGREYIVTAWWVVVMPGLILFLTALSINLIAGWAQNITDPRQRARWLRAGLKSE
jgi:peptide/nickel transport system permease protein